MQASQVVTICVSICSLLSSVCYTYVYVRGQKAAIFNEIHTEYASPDIMEAFDALEHFQEATGPSKYAEEYIRLKSQAREAFVSKPGLLERMGLRSDSNSEVELSRRLELSRRRILHFLGKLVMYNTWGYLTTEMMHEFPGKARAMHAISLLQPLVSHTAIQFGFEEHQRVLDGIRNIYQIAPQVEQAIESSPAPAVEEYTLRLSSFPRGELYIAVGGTMRPVCGHWFWNDNGGAISACKALGYRSGVLHRTKSRLRTNAVYIGGCKDGESLGNCTGLIREFGSCTRYSVGCGQCAMGESAGVEIECLKDEEDDCSANGIACPDKEATAS